MPELPEVETLRRELAGALPGRKIEAVKIFWPKTVAPSTPNVFSRQLRGQKITRVQRCAKILLLGLGPKQTLAIHLKMTGQLIFKPKKGRVVIGGHPANPERHTRAIFNFTDDSQLLFNDLRKFGWLRLVNRDETKAIESAHGPEPLSPVFTFKYFRQLLTRYPNRNLKTLLLDQKLIAGLGNIYVDESAHRAHILPQRRAASLQPSEVTKLYRAIKTVLRAAIKAGGTSARNYVKSDGQPGGFVPQLRVYGRVGELCRTCRHAKILKIKLAGRGTHYCQRCQS